MVSQVANACMAVFRRWGEDLCTCLFIICIFMYIFLFVFFKYFCIVFHIFDEGDDPVHLAVNGHAVAKG